MKATIGVDLGGSQVRVAVVDLQGGIRHEHQAPRPDDGSRIADEIAHVTSELRAAARRDDLDVGAIGVGVAALVDDDGVARYSPNLPSLSGVPLRAEIMRASGLPVVVDNDANVAATGELAHGALRGMRHALLLTLGTGIGGGIVIDGRVYRGAHGFAAEVGHWQFDPAGRVCACGEPGHWEAWGSGTALGTLAREVVARGGAPGVAARAGGVVAEVVGEHVGAAALDGDAAALGILDTFAEAVAVGMSGLANILDPQAIVVGGGLVNLGDVLLSRLRDRFRSRIEAPAARPEIPILAAQLGDLAGVIGAAVLARPLG